MKITGMDFRGDTSNYAGTLLITILKMITEQQIRDYLTLKGWTLEVSTSNAWGSVYVREHPDDKKDFVVLLLPGKRQQASNPAAFMEPLERISLVEDTTFLAVVCSILKVDHLILSPSTDTTHKRKKN